MSDEALAEGVDRLKIDDVDVPVFTAARTIVDCFRFRNKIGLDVALEALRDGWNQRKFTLDDLWRHAASIRARLKQHTDTSKQDFNLTLTRYGLERLLYRLSSSGHTPTLRAYPKATVVAEKLHALTVLGMTNARVKDFFDFALLLRDATLDDAELQRATEATFARRQTAMRSAVPIGLSVAFASDEAKQMQWRAFLKKNKLELMELRDVVTTVRERAMRFGFTGT